MSKVENFYQVEFMLNEEKKVTIKSKNEDYSLYVLGVVTNNPEYKRGKSLYELIATSLSEFCEKEKFFPLLDDPICINVRLHGSDGIEDYTIFGFYRNYLSTKVATALFDEEITEIPEEELEYIRNYKE